MQVIITLLVIIYFVSLIIDFDATYVIDRINKEEGEISTGIEAVSTIITDCIPILNTAFMIFLISIYFNDDTIQYYWKKYSLISKVFNHEEKF